jgi:SpoVK/Ycf46/Vps4 family AAA+-type ATPase
VEEHHRRDLLRSYNLEPRHRVLLAGPPGNGKTSLAEALAEMLMVPLYAVQYEHIIGSYLGETSAQLGKVFEFVRQRECVLFFDEFDVVGKERGDENETGEIKRVVSSLLLQVDKLPSHVVVVVASNHPELLDKAVWRRFQLRLHLPPPCRDGIATWLADFERQHEISFGRRRNTIAKALEGVSFAEVEQFGLDVLRRYVLAQPDADVNSIVTSRLAQWKARFQHTTSE